MLTILPLRRSRISGTTCREHLSAVNREISRTKRHVSGSEHQNSVAFSRAL